ncbi:hypothetical protein B0H11DRAFT_2193175 [Mycena galericulata]|nr:hypothetical protein B0H11DRAFT_2193175 [Mycena galericulata]
MTNIDAAGSEVMAGGGAAEISVMNPIGTRPKRDVSQSGCTCPPNALPSPFGGYLREGITAGSIYRGRIFKPSAVDSVYLLIKASAVSFAASLTDLCFTVHDSGLIKSHAQEFAPSRSIGYARPGLPEFSSDCIGLTLRRSAVSFQSAATIPAGSLSAPMCPLVLHLPAVCAPMLRARCPVVTCVGYSYQALRHFHTRATSGYQALAESYAVPNNGDLSTWLSQVSELSGDNCMSLPDQKNVSKHTK